jgi:hypothetical protein
VASVVPPDVVTAFGLKLTLLVPPLHIATQEAAAPAAVLIRKDRHTARASILEEVNGRFGGATLEFSKSSKSAVGLFS